MWRMSEGTHENIFKWLQFLFSTSFESSQIICIQYKNIPTHWTPPNTHTQSIRLALCWQNKALFVATLSGSISGLCHISGVSPSTSPARLHQVPVTVPPGCPWNPRDTIAPFVPHHKGITAISIKVKEVSYGNDGWTQNIQQRWSQRNKNRLFAFFI